MIRIVLLWKVVIAALCSRSNQQFYDRISPYYDQVFVEHQIHADTITELLCEVYAGQEPTTRVLDLGCGTGMLSCRLANHGFDVTGLDISPDSLQLLQQRNPIIKIVLGDASIFPFADNAFQAVVSLGSWRHFTKTEKLIMEIVRALDDNGILVIGYFPPALGGILHLGQGIWRRLIERRYLSLTSKLGYVDKSVLSLEPQTISLLENHFSDVHTVVSGKKWRLIIAKKPI